MIDNYIADQSPRITMTLSEILANTPPVQTLAQATDVPGTNLEWMKTAAYPTGAWFGDLGELGTTGFRGSLFTDCLALGATCKVSGVPYSWSGSAWVAVGGGGGIQDFATYALLFADTALPVNSVASVSGVLYRKITGCWVPANNATPLGRQVRIGTYGPSTCNFFPTSVTDTESVSFAIPASGNTQVLLDASRNPLLAARPIDAVVSGGINAQTMTQMLARSAAAYSTTRKSTSDVSAKLPDAVVVIHMAINDFAGSKAGTDIPSTAAALYLKHQRLVSALLDSGSLVIDVPFYGAGVGVSGDLPTVCAIGLALNALAFADAGVNPRWIVWNPIGVTCDAAGLIFAAASDDGVHLNAIGGGMANSVIAPILDAYFFGRVTFASMVYDGQNAWANPTTNMPSGWTKDGSSVASTATACDITGVTLSIIVSNATNLFAMKRLNVGPALTGVVSGEKIKTMLAFEYVSGPSLGGFVNASAYSVLADSGNVGLLVTGLKNLGIKCVANSPQSITYSVVVDRDASAFGSSSYLLFSLTNLPVGTHVIKIRPISVFK